MNDREVILDTNIVSYIMKGHTFATLYEHILRNHVLSISFITVGELYYGAQKANWGEHKLDQLEEVLHSFIIIPYDQDTARHFGRIMSESERIGRRLLHNDAWIAACATRHKIPLVTHDAKDFHSISSLTIITEQS